MEKKLTMSDKTRSDLQGGKKSHWSIPKFSTSGSEEKLVKENEKELPGS